MGLALTHWLEQPTVWINLEGHGREELFDGVDLSRTVGWFTTIFPVKLDLNGIGGPGEVLKSVKEQLRRIPHRGIGYGMLRYLCGDENVAAQLRALWQPEVIFNYLGQFDRTVPTSPFVLVEGSIGPAQSTCAAQPSAGNQQLGGRRPVAAGLALQRGGASAQHDRTIGAELSGGVAFAHPPLHIAKCWRLHAVGFRRGGPGSGETGSTDFQTQRVKELNQGIMTMQDKNIESIYPLSPMQQGMLFHTLLAPKSGVYFNQVLYTLTGTLQEAAFQLAWQQVVDRHEPLRTLFVWEEQEKPLQVVRRRVALPWEELDWRGLSADQQTLRLEEFLQADRQRGFDVAQAPLMRLTLIRMEEHRYELIWSQHHLLMDGWSGYLVLKEIVAVYQAISQGLEYRMELSRPYRDYVNWLQRQDLSKAEGFWRAALKGFTAPTPLLGNRVG